MINATQRQGRVVPSSFHALSRAPKGYLRYTALFHDLYKNNPGPFYYYCGTSLLDSDYITKAKGPVFTNIPFQFWYLVNPLPEQRL